MKLPLASEGCGLLGLQKMVALRPAGMLLNPQLTLLAALGPRFRQTTSVPDLFVGGGAGGEGSAASISATGLPLTGLTNKARCGGGLVHGSSPSP